MNAKERRKLLRQQQREQAEAEAEAKAKVNAEPDAEVAEPEVDTADPEGIAGPEAVAASPEAETAETETEPAGDPDAAGVEFHEALDEESHQAESAASTPESGSDGSDVLGIAQAGENEATDPQVNVWHAEAD